MTLLFQPRAKRDAEPAPEISESWLLTVPGDEPEVSGELNGAADGADNLEALLAGWGDDAGAGSSMHVTSAAIDQWFVALDAYRDEYWTNGGQDQGGAE